MNRRQRRSAQRKVMHDLVENTGIDLGDGDRKKHRRVEQDVMHTSKKIIRAKNSLDHLKGTALITGNATLEDVMGLDNLGDLGDLVEETLTMGAPGRKYLDLSDPSSEHKEDEETTFSPSSKFYSSNPLVGLNPSLPVSLAKKLLPLELLVDIPRSFTEENNRYIEGNYQGSMSPEQTLLLVKKYMDDRRKHSSKTSDPYRHKYVWQAVAYKDLVAKQIRFALQSYIATGKTPIIDDEFQIAIGSKNILSRDASDPSLISQAFYDRNYRNVSGSAPSLASNFYGARPVDLDKQKRTLQVYSWADVPPWEREEAQAPEWEVSVKPEDRLQYAAVTERAMRDPSSRPVLVADKTRDAIRRMPLPEHDITADLLPDKGSKLLYAPVSASNYFMVLETPYTIHTKEGVCQILWISITNVRTHYHKLDAFGDVEYAQKRLDEINKDHEHLPDFESLEEVNEAMDGDFVVDYGYIDGVAAANVGDFDSIQLSQYKIASTRFSHGESYPSLLDTSVTEREKELLDFVIKSLNFMLSKASATHDSNVELDARQGVGRHTNTPARDIVSNVKVVNLRKIEHNGEEVPDDIAYGDGSDSSKKDKNPMRQHWVTGHYRQQKHGIGRTLTKLIYIEPFIKGSGGGIAENRMTVYRVAR